MAPYIGYRPAGQSPSVARLIMCPLVWVVCAVWAWVDGMVPGMMRRKNLMLYQVPPFHLLLHLLLLVCVVL